MERSQAMISAISQRLPASACLGAIARSKYQMAHYNSRILYNHDPPSDLPTIPSQKNETSKLMAVVSCDRPKSVEVPA